MNTALAERGPGFARAADALRAEGDGDAARRLLADGLAREPRNVIALLVLARLDRDEGRVEEARARLEDALRIDPECPAALMLRAELPGGRDTAEDRRRLAAQEPWDEEFRAATDGPPETSVATPVPASAPAEEPAAAPAPEQRAAREAPAPAFVFPVREEEEEPEIGENAAPHIATVTLAEIYLQQGLKEQAAQIYRQLLERQPADDAVRRRLEEILRETEGS